MKHVWKCDYCPETGTKRKIERHEKKCCFNPVNRDCCTCMHWVEYPFSDIYSCALGFGQHSNCNGWRIK